MACPPCCPACRRPSDHGACPGPLPRLHSRERSAVQGLRVVSEATLKPGMAIPEPAGPVILTVSGRIKSGKPVRFDLATLESLGLIRFTTLTSWTDGAGGVRRGAAVGPAGCRRGRSRRHVPEPYRRSTISKARRPIADGRKWPVMLALKRDGEYMSRRDRGPIWMIYPQHAYPELGQREYFSRWVWQLKAITVE